ncbi:hypothetical protein JTE90_027897, partial [Oedothorax gibbosus]
QSCPLSGGSVPVMGFHSVIDNPALVSLVNPPIPTMRITMTEQRKSQIATGFASINHV